MLKKKHLKLKIIQVSIIGFLMLMVFSCNLKKKDMSLNDKIANAIESRKIPEKSKEEKIFSSPHWLLERSELNSEILRHMEEYLPTVKIDKGNGEITRLPTKSDSQIGKEILTSAYYRNETSLDSLCKQKSLNGIIVLHKGQIIYEDYPDMDSSERHNYFSVSKTFAGTIIAILADQGKLNEHDSIGKYLHEFRNKPLGKVSINDLLRMSSGINCREIVENDASFKDPKHNFYKFLQYRAIYPEPENGFDKTLMEFFAGVGAYEPAGKTNDYTSANTAILATIAERVSNTPYHQLMSELIWSKIGAEDDARITLSSTGIPGSAGFIMSRLRDLARYGLAFTDDAPIKIASDRYLQLLREGDRDLFLTDEAFANIFEGQGAAFQSYHWDVVFDDGDFAKFGFGGQGLYISPDKRLVVAFFSANKDETSHNKSMYYLVRSLALLDRFQN